MGKFLSRTQPQTLCTLISSLQGNATVASFILDRQKLPLAPEESFKAATYIPSTACILVVKFSSEFCGNSSCSLLIFVLCMSLQHLPNYTLPFTINFFSFLYACFSAINTSFMVGHTLTISSFQNFCHSQAKTGAPSKCLAKCKSPVNKSKSIHLLS